MEDLTKPEHTNPSVQEANPTALDNPAGETITRGYLLDLVDSRRQARAEVARAALGGVMAEVSAFLPVEGSLSQ